MEILSFDPSSMDISIAVNSGENCGSPTDSIGEFLLGLTTSPQLDDYPYPCFYDHGFALLIYPVSFPLVNINAPGPWLQSGDTVSFNVVDAFLGGSDASLCWQDAINDGFFEEQCWVISITQINDSHPWPYESGEGVGGFEYPDVNLENNSVQFSPLNPLCNPVIDGEPNPCEDPSVFIPNAFTPNGDGKNEAFGAVISSPPSCWWFWEFKVYNRWGNMIFESEYPGQRWIGDVYRGEYFAPDGVYVWHLKARHRYGEWYDLHGHVTMFR
tara:strand:- start:8480 stop:9289 length:810 start_codon:yes stop_codon:yes gene_type:complete